MGIHVGYGTIERKRFNDAVSFMTSYLIPLLAKESVDGDMLDVVQMQTEQHMWEYVVGTAMPKLLRRL